MFIISSKKMLHFLKISDDLVLVVSSISYISTIQNAAGTSTTAQVQLHKYNCTSTTAQPISSDLSCIIHSPNCSVFTSFFHSGTSKFTTTTAQLPFTTANYILQLQKLSSVAR